jgi:hypothetical protein
MLVKVVDGVELLWSHGEMSPLPFVEPSCMAELAQVKRERETC